MKKCIRIRGKQVGGQFKVTEYQDVSNQFSDSSFDDHDTIMNILRLRFKNRKSNRGLFIHFQLYSETNGTITKQE